MLSEEQELAAKVSHLAGQINRVKNQRAGIISTPSHHRATPYSRHNPRQQRGSYPIRGYGPHAPIHRNKTLVLNGQNPETENGLSATFNGYNTAWIQRSDRHLQLINPAVYEKTVQARKQATKQDFNKFAARNQAEQAKFAKYLDRTHAAVAAGQPGPPAKYEVKVDGIPFMVIKNGNKLVKLPGDNNAAKATPKVAIVGGVKFNRSKHGNLYRHGIVKAQRHSGPAVQKLQVPCKAFSTTGNPLHKSKSEIPRPCRRDLGFGSCSQGPRCRYVHDPSKVMVCKDLLMRGDCPSGDACDLSHDLTPERTPMCLHFAKGNCTNTNCRYAHVKVSPAAPVCRAFGLYGYCEKGATCPERHAFECPDFSNKGVCKTKGCKLLHRERASVLRKVAAASTTAAGDEMDDVSSDEDGDSVDEYDVDSDEVDEFIGQDENLAYDMAEQRDFIEL